MNNEKKLAHIFKTFINTVLLPTFRTNQPVYQEWNYFSNIVSQQALDYKMLEVYIDVLLKSGPQTFYHNNTITNPSPPTSTFKLDLERLKTNSMLYPQKIENESFNYDHGFQLNKTMGASDRSRITAMFPSKPSSNMFVPEPVSSKLVSKTSIKAIEQPNSILSEMEKIYKTLSENQLRLEGNSLQMNGGGTTYYKFKEDRRP